MVGSDAPPEANTFEASGGRVDIAAHGCDDPSPGMPLASSLLCSAHAFERRGGVLAIATRSLVAQGTAGVTPGPRRGVEAQGWRGPSALNMGWNGVQLARSREDERLTSVHLSAIPAPVPARASTIQHQKHSQRFLTLAFQGAVA